MQPDDIEPLEPGHWLRRVAQLATQPLKNERDLDRALRHAFHLVQLAPRPLRHVVSARCDEARFEHLLAARRFEQASRQLIGAAATFELDRTGETGAAVAAVWYPDQCDRHHATERSAAAALLRAWLRCNAALACHDTRPTAGGRKLAAIGSSTHH